MLDTARVAARLPAQDLERARRFHSEKLGLEPSEERLGGLLYVCGGTEFGLFETTGVSAGELSGAVPRERAVPALAVPSRLAWH